MKVRHKQTGVVVEVQEPAGLWWILRPASPEVHYAVPMSDYEEIKTDRWQDVTGEVIDSISGISMIHPDWLNNVCVPDGYRLRKVQLKREQGEHLSDLTVWAFIVERKVA